MARLRLPGGVTAQAQWALASQIVTSGANFTSSVLLLRALGLDGFGRYSLCLIAIMVARNFLDTMVLVPVSTIGPKLQDTSLAAYRGFILIKAGGFSILASALLAGLFLGVGLLDGYGWAAGAVLPLALANLLANLSDFMRRVGFVFERAALAFLIDLTRFSIQIALILLLIRFGGDWLTETSALYALALGSLAGALLGAATYGSLRFRAAFLRAAWPRHWRFSRWMLPATFLGAIQNNGPVIIASAFLGDAAVGLVRGIQQVTNVLNLPFNAATQILPSITSRKLVQHGHRAAIRFLAKMATGAALVLVAGSGALFLLAPTIFETWMKIDHPETYSVFALYCLLNLVSLIQLHVTVYFWVIEKGAVLAKALGLGAILSCCAILLLLLFLGVVSVPIAQISGVGAALAFAVMQLGKHHPAIEK